MAGTYTIGSAQVGTVIDATAGKITTIQYLTHATGWDPPAFDPVTGFPTKGYFCLVDTGYNILGALRPLMSVEQSNSAGFSPGTTHSFSNFPYSQLKLQSCPPGATFSITTV
jgi:hypothetical protein